jgi:hypothetical protein
VICAAAFQEAALIHLFGSHKPTERGAAAAGRWLGVRAFLERGDAFESLPPGAVILWERYMSYAAALGLARGAVSVIPMGAEDDERAWSAFGGEWREVQVSYPHSRIVWGRSPFGALVAGAVVTAFGTGWFWMAAQTGVFSEGIDTSNEFNKWAGIAGLIVGLIAAFIIFTGLRSIYLALADVGHKVPIEGEIIRLRTHSRGENKVDYFMAVFDGRAAKVRAWVVNQDLYQRFHEGSIVKALVCPRLGYVSDIELVRAPNIVPGTPASHPEVETRVQTFRVDEVIPLKLFGVDLDAVAKSQRAGDLEAQPDHPST